MKILGGSHYRGPQPQNPSANFEMENLLFPPFVGGAKSCCTFSHANSCKVSEENIWVCGFFFRWEKKNNSWVPLIKFVCISGQKCKTKNEGWTDARMHGFMHARMHRCMDEHTRWKNTWIHGGKGGRKDGSSQKPPLGCKNATTAAASPTASHKSLTVVYVLAEKQWAHLLAPWPRDILSRLSSHQYFKKVEVLYFGVSFQIWAFVLHLHQKSKGSPRK